MITAVAVSSCNQELMDTQDDPVPEEGLLKQKVTISLPDSSYRITENFSYDASSRLVGYSIDNMETLYIRDELGRIVRIQSRSGAGAPVITTDVFYESSSSKKVKYLSDSSAVFIYNDLGQVIRTDTYQHWPTPTSPLKRVAYHQYTYDSRGNLQKRAEYTDVNNDGQFDLTITYTLSYDDKVNPTRNTDDALIETSYLTRWQNNLLKQQNDAALPGGIDDENNSLYEYRADNKPVTGLFTGGDGRKTITRFYYY